MTTPTRISVRTTSSIPSPPPSAIESVNDFSCSHSAHVHMVCSSVVVSAHCIADVCVVSSLGLSGA